MFLASPPYKTQRDDMCSMVSLTTDDDENSFWTVPVLALAGILVVINIPSILSQATLAGMVGGVIGAVLAALALAALLKGGYQLVSRRARDVTPQ